MRVLLISMADVGLISVADPADQQQDRTPSGTLLGKIGIRIRSKPVTPAGDSPYISGKDGVCFPSSPHSHPSLGATVARWVMRCFDCMLLGTCILCLQMFLCSSVCVGPVLKIDWKFNFEFKALLVCCSLPGLDRVP